MIAAALERRQSQYVFPWQMRLASLLLPLVPDFLLPTHATKV